jgi:hypothetical protein
MAEYSRLASGQTVARGVEAQPAGQTAVVLPFLPDFIEIYNRTRAVAGSGVTRAWWVKDAGQGSAFLDTFGTGEQFIAPVGGTSSGALVSGTGFSTIQAGLSLQYGPTFFLGGSGGIAKTSATLLTVTTTANHNLTTGDWVTFQNLYQTSTTGMQQIAGIPFMVTVTGATTFTIDWVGNSSNLTAITTGGLNTLASFKKILYPVLYAPGVAYPWKIDVGTTTTIHTTAPHNYVVGQQVGFRIPAPYGMTDLNELPNTTLPGFPIYYYVTAVTDSTTFVINVDSTAFTAFTVNNAFLSFPGLKFAEVVAVGDVNTGGWPYNGGDLYPSPRFFNGFTSSTTVGVSTINGPAISGAFSNATFMGFIIGSGVGGTTGDVIYWRAYMHDINYP